MVSTRRLKVSLLAAIVWMLMATSFAQFHTPLAPAISTAPATAIMVGQPLAVNWNSLPPRK